MTAFERIQVAPLAGALGAEIGGVDVAAESSGSSQARLDQSGRSNWIGW